VIVPSTESASLRALATFLIARNKIAAWRIPTGEIDLGSGVVFHLAPSVFTCPDDPALTMRKEQLTRGVYTLLPSRRLPQSAVVVLINDEVEVDSWYFNHEQVSRLAKVIHLLKVFYPLRSRWTQ